MNKTVETVEEPILGEGETLADKNKHDNPDVQASSWAKETPLLTRCSVTLNKLSEWDLKRMCNQKAPRTESGQPESYVLVENRYQTRSSMKPKQEKHNR